MRQRLAMPPSWLDDLASFLATRYSPARSIDVLRALGQSWPADTPAELVDAMGERSHWAGAVIRTFFIDAGQSIDHPAVDQAAVRRQWRIDATPDPWRKDLARFAAAQLTERDRARRLGLRLVADRTIEGRLAVVRDLALVCEQHGLHGWREVTTADLEAFLSPVQRTHGVQLASLRHFFQWMLRKRLIFADPTRPLTINTNPRFQPPALTVAHRRELFQRWIDPRSDAHEAFAGLAAMLYGATKSELRQLTVSDIDTKAQAIQLGHRDHAVTVDPWTWDALDRCLDLRALRAPNNPHVITAARRGACPGPVGVGYFDRHMAPIRPITLRTLRANHLASTVERVDPIVLARAHGITTKGALYYLADQDPVL